MTRPTVMVVDDQPDICAIVQFTVENDGYLCLSFVDAGEALAHVCDSANLQPQLIFLDYMMPGCDGRAFLQVLDQRGIRHRYHIVLFSAITDLEQVREELGCDEMLAKPFSLSEISQMVETAISLKPLDPAPSPSGQSSDG